MPSLSTLSNFNLPLIHFCVFILVQIKPKLAESQGRNKMYFIIVFCSVALKKKKLALLVMEKWMYNNDLMIKLIEIQRRGDILTLCRKVVWRR